MSSLMFKVCALKFAVDWSEDSKIHCFKKGETCEAGDEQLSVFQVISGLGNPHKLCRPSLLVLLSM